MLNGLKHLSRAIEEDTKTLGLDTRNIQESADSFRTSPPIYPML
jgi:hypothetical protein